MPAGHLRSRGYVQESGPKAAAKLTSRFRLGCGLVPPFCQSWPHHTAPASLSAHWVVDHVSLASTSPCQLVCSWDTAAPCNAPAPTTPPNSTAETYRQLSQTSAGLPLDSRKLGPVVLACRRTYEPRLPVSTNSTAPQLRPSQDATRVQGLPSSGLRTGRLPPGHPPPVRRQCASSAPRCQKKQGGLEPHINGHEHRHGDGVRAHAGFSPIDSEFHC